MIALLEAHKDALARLCREYGVRRLEVFGSAARGEDFAVSSDVDLLVEFAPDTDFGPWLAHYFEFKEHLQELLGKEVDLVMAGSLRNPYLLRAIDRDRKLLYAA
ncbi:MAG: nucleotidyltransferase domain-containing protein [Truepera sp.]|nr:nucleotidyltransferase domain-containing protein [Truepera sp.]